LFLYKKTQAQQSFLRLQHTRPKLSLYGAGLRELDVDSVNSSGDYFEYLCITASETTLHQKRMPITDRLHLGRQTVETNCKYEPCHLVRVVARRAWITVVL
jgi:hypothetical protein